MLRNIKFKSMFSLKKTPARFAPLTRRLRQSPLPLIDPNHRMLVSWSAKSACTHVLVWHFDRLGLLEEAEAYHSWLHRYREEKYHSSTWYQAARRLVEREDTVSWTFVKVVRDPVRRCISSYRHALKHGYEDALMSRKLGREIGHITGFSFETFLDYLARINLHKCNIHHRVQRHSLDLLPYRQVFLINIDREDLDAALSRIDSLHGLDRSSDRERQDRAIARAARRHASNRRQAVPDPELWRQPLRSADVDDWPAQALQEATPAIQRIREIYACDYEMMDFLGRGAME